VASPPPAPQSAVVVADDEQTEAAGNEQGTSEKRRKKKRKKKRAAQQSNAWIWMVGIGGTVAMIGVIGLILFATLGWERVVIEAISLAITIPISTIFLVISMLIANSVLGGLDFGEPKIAIPKAAILLLLVNLAGRVPLPAGYFLPSLFWIFG